MMLLISHMVEHDIWQVYMLWNKFSENLAAWTPIVINKKTRIRGVATYA
jgi:hypothetical protein